MKILTAYTLNSQDLLTLKAFNHKMYGFVVVVFFLSSTKIFEASYTNRVDPDQRSSLIWVHIICLYGYVT